MYPQYWTPSIGGIFMKYSYEYKKKCAMLMLERGTFKVQKRVRDCLF